MFMAKKPEMTWFGCFQQLIAWLWLARQAPTRQAPSLTHDQTSFDFRGFSVVAQFENFTSFSKAQLI